jgi:hypothetical protein
MLTMSIHSEIEDFNSLIFSATEIPFRPKSGFRRRDRLCEKSRRCTSPEFEFYVPCEDYEGKSVEAYTAETVPIFLPSSVGGYMPGQPGSETLQRSWRPEMTRTLETAAPVGSDRPTAPNRGALCQGAAK